MGAKWTYQNFTPSDDLGYPIAFQIESIRDTVVESRSARIVRNKALYENGTWKVDGEEVVASNGDSVFVLVKNTFHLIYDFSASPGDTIRVVADPFPGFFHRRTQPYENFVYRIDSVSSYIAGTDTLRKQFVSYLKEPVNTLQWGFQDLLDILGDVPGQILEGVGSLGRLSMLGTSADVSYVFDSTSDRLTCYQDSTRTYILNGVDCDALIDSYEVPGSSRHLAYYKGAVYPNPFTEEINLFFGQLNPRAIRIIDAMGRVVFTQTNPNNQLHLRALPPGTYLMQLIDHAGRHAYTTITKT